MIKKLLAALIALTLLLPLCGCWNYRGLNDMTVVVGIAIDKDGPDGDYRLTYEYVDISQPVKEVGVVSKILESKGETLFAAARNAKKEVSNKLYFGHTMILVISEDIARTENVGGIIDWFLRDAEIRETLCLIVSQEKTAHDVLSGEGTDQKVTSNEISQIVEEDNKVTSSTICYQLYEIFNIVESKDKELAAPAFHVIEQNDKQIVELNGCAVFKGQRLIGYLTPEESKYALFVLDEIKGGVLPISSTGGHTEDVTLEISENSTKISFQQNNGKLTMEVSTDTVVYLDEYRGTEDLSKKEKIEALEQTAEAALEKSIQAVIKTVQVKYDSDIFGFGKAIRQKDPKLWKQLESSWDEQFRTLEVRVKSKIRIANTATIKLMKEG